ncbi:hypothetical protein BV898_11022 [Hypsibius exemplaris]|uniref:Uncharacterized protein n=1 Tax=Hypsibius exemplaris TaxID=2072580 RepID=A0A1W0WHT0_HYPEX|nr:hypothetical protein BV898_11022 [Hypsibius exemplaris]
MSDGRKPIHVQQEQAAGEVEPSRKPTPTSSAKYSRTGHATPDQHGSCLLRRNAGLPGMGMEVPNALLPQLFYGAIPYGFSPADWPRFSRTDVCRSACRSDSLCTCQHRVRLIRRAGTARVTAKRPADLGIRTTWWRRMAGEGSSMPQAGSWQHIGAIPPEMLRIQEIRFEPEKIFNTLWHGSLALKNDHAFCRDVLP